MQSPTPATVDVTYQGTRYRFDLATVHALLINGLSLETYQVIALIAHAWHCSIPELMRRAIEIEVQP